MLKSKHRAAAFSLTGLHLEMLHSLGEHGSEETFEGPSTVVQRLIEDAFDERFPGVSDCLEDRKGTALETLAPIIEASEGGKSPVGKVELRHMKQAAADAAVSGGLSELHLKLARDQDGFQKAMDAAQADHDERFPKGNPDFLQSARERELIAWLGWDAHGGAQ